MEKLSTHRTDLHEHLCTTFLLKFIDSVQYLFLSSTKLTEALYDDLGAFKITSMSPYFVTEVTDVPTFSVIVFATMITLVSNVASLVYLLLLGGFSRYISYLLETLKSTIYCHAIRDREVDKIT